MGKIIKKNDEVFQIRFEYPHYSLEQRVGKWYNRKWNVLYKTINKTLFIKKLNTYLV